MLLVDDGGRVPSLSESEFEAGWSAFSGQKLELRRAQGRDIYYLRKTQSWSLHCPLFIKRDQLSMLGVECEVTGLRGRMIAAANNLE